MGVLRTAHNQRNSSRRYVSKKPASRPKTAHKKPASAQQGLARSNANRPCAQCIKRSDKCVCYQEVPLTGKLSSTTLRGFVKFLETDRRRRYLSDCLDLRLIVAWIWQQTLAGMHRTLVILGVLLFRHFNRIFTWVFLRKAFGVTSRSPLWTRLEDELRSADEALHKAFSRPVTILDEDGAIVGSDTIENCVLSYKAIWQCPAFKKFAKLLGGGVRIPAEFHKLMTEYQSLQSAFPGAFGPYRQKTSFMAVL